MQHVQQLKAIGSDWSTEACIGALLMNKSSSADGSACATTSAASASNTADAARVQFDLNAAVETLFNVSAIPGGLETLAAQGKKLHNTPGGAASPAVVDRPPPEL